MKQVCGRKTVREPVKFDKEHSLFHTIGRDFMSLREDARRVDDEFRTCVVCWQNGKRGLIVARAG